MYLRLGIEIGLVLGIGIELGIGLGLRIGLGLGLGLRIWLGLDGTPSLHIHPTCTWQHNADVVTTMGEMMCP